MNICEMNSLNVYVVSEVMESFLPKPKVFLSFCEAFKYLIGEIKIIFNYKGSEANLINDIINRKIDKCCIHIEPKERIVQVWDWTMGTENEHYFSICERNISFSSKDRLKMFTQQSIEQKTFEEFNIEAILYGMRRFGISFFDSIQALYNFGIQCEHPLPDKSSRYEDIFDEYANWDEEKEEGDN